MSSKPKKTQPKKPKAPKKTKIDIEQEKQTKKLLSLISEVVEVPLPQKPKDDLYTEFKLLNYKNYFKFLKDKHPDILKNMQVQARLKAKTPEAIAKSKATRKRKALKIQPCITGCNDSKAEALKTVMAMFGTCKKQCKTKKQTGAEATMTLLKNMGIA
jgi:ADP-heptose:LPS heptosyltransferase